MRGDDPTRRVSRALPEAPECPFCEGHETELFNAFGSQLSVSTYWCRECRSPFEYMKWGPTDVGYLRAAREGESC
jgi:transcription elongation factor Elf1